MMERTTSKIIYRRIEYKTLSNLNVNSGLQKPYSLNSFSLKSLPYKQSEDMLSELEVLDRVTEELCRLGLLLSSCGVLASAFGRITFGLERIALVPVFLRPIDDGLDGVI